MRPATLAALGLALALAGCNQANTASQTNVAATAQSHPATYLATISVPLGERDRVSAFRIETWGVQVRSVCHLPAGWTITAGSSANPSGLIAGEGSHGVTWIGREQAPSLENLVLVTLSAPVDPQPVNSRPATFAGTATLDDANTERTVPLGAANVRLMPASRCPG